MMYWRFGVIANSSLPHRFATTTPRATANNPLDSWVESTEPYTNSNSKY